MACGKIWHEHGALEYLECVGDDLDINICQPFTRAIKVKRGETLIFSWIVFKSRAQRDRINAKIMRDPRILAMMQKPPPFDCKRMHYGGFKTFVSA